MPDPPAPSQTSSPNPLRSFKRDAEQGQRGRESIGHHASCPWDGCAAPGPRPAGVFPSVFNFLGGTGHHFVAVEDRGWLLVPDPSPAVCRSELGLREELG